MPRTLVLTLVIEMTDYYKMQLKIAHVDNRNVLVFTTQTEAVSDSSWEGIAASECGIYVACVSQVIVTWVYDITSETW